VYEGIWAIKDLAQYRKNVLPQQSICKWPEKLNNGTLSGEGHNITSVHYSEMLTNRLKPAI
jgi:hypothetical protein